MNMLTSLAEKVRRYPQSPGVYLIKDAVGRIIYIGKARSLRQRVRNYVTADSAAPPRMQAIQAQMCEIDYMVTDSEVEALILECNLIKEHRPRYNIDLKDDKDYPCLRLTGGPYPRLEYIRLSQKEKRRQKSGQHEKQQAAEEKDAHYFGPYTDVGAVRKTMRLLGKIFPLRRCRRPLTGEPVGERPCLNFQMKRCLGPCRGAAAVPPEEYSCLVRWVVSFLEGGRDILERQLEEQMHRAAQGECFEKAARLRDQLLAIRRVTVQEQKVLDLKEGADRDVHALVRHDATVAVHLFIVREGKLIRSEHFTLGSAAEADDGEALGAFVKSYYSRGARLPKEVVLSSFPDDQEILEDWLQGLAGKKVKIIVPRRGSRRRLVEMALRNGLLKLQGEQERAERRVALPLEELGRLVGLENMPNRIEGYDISHLHGGAAVGVMVVFEQGRPFKDSYRRFHLRQTPPGDDCAALREVVQRRLAHSEWPRPELLLVDGGRAQLNAVREILQQAGLKRIALLALAENPDRIFLEQETTPVLLPANSALLQLLQRIRDEAHRFAIDYHRRLRRRSATRSRLEEIPGIGPQRRAVLLNHFGSLEQLYRATEEELAAVNGISRILAERIYRKLHL